MGNFLDDLRDYELHYKKKDDEILHAENLVRSCIQAIKTSVKANYKKGSLSGYLSEDLGYDDTYFIIVEEPIIETTKLKRIEDVCKSYKLDKNKLMDYASQMLPQEIRKLGFEDFDFRFEQIQSVDLNSNRRLLSPMKYKKGGNITVLYIRLSW